MNEIDTTIENVVPHFADQTLAAGLPSGVIVLNPQGLMLWWNPAAERLLPLKAPRDNFKPLASIIDMPEFPQYLHAKTYKTLEICAPTQPDNRLSLVVVSYEQNHFLVSIEDISHTYHIERMRQDFVANVSHELRTPLTVIRGYLEMLVDEKLLAPPPWHKILDQMYDQSLRMEKLVEDLLLLSQLETEGLPETQGQQRVNIPRLLATICDEARALSSEKKHNIILSIPKEFNLYGHEDELRSAFSNLIFNAVKYTPADGAIYVNWYQDKKGAHFSVRDTGIGIEKKHISRLTQRFYRVDKARSRAKGGTGLGLAIVKHVLIRHDAVLVIESEIDKGSEFRCIFPLELVIE